MPEYSRVEFPMLRIVPLRRAKPGMELEKSAFDRNGRVIAEPGETLTEERIRQFENLNVRKVVVTDTNVQWIPAEEAESYSGDVTVLETREFNEAAGEIVDTLQADQSVEQLRRTALYLRDQAERAGDAGGAAYLDDLIDRSYELEEEIDELTDRLENVENEQVREEIIEALEGAIRRLDEVFMEVSAPDSLVKDSVEAINEKENIRSSLSEYVTDNPEVLRNDVEGSAEDSPEVDADADSEWEEPLRTLLEGETIEGINEFVAESEDRGVHSTHVEELQELAETIKHQVEEKETLKEEMSEYDLDLQQRKTLMDALDGRDTFRKSELLTLPVSQQFASKTYELMQAEMDSRYRLWEAVDEVSDGDVSEVVDKRNFLRESRTDGSGEKPPDGEPEEVSLSRDELYGVLDTLEDDVQGALDDVTELLEDREGVGARTTSKLRTLSERFDSLESEREELVARVRSGVDDPDREEYLLNLLNREVPFDPEELFELDLPMGLLEDVADFVSGLEDGENEVWEELNELTERNLYDREVRDGDEADRLDQKLNRTTERFSDGGSDNSSATDPETESPAIDEEAPLLEFVRVGEPYEVANRTGLETSTVEAAQEFLTPPDDVDPNEKFYCNPLVEQVQKIFYGRELDEGTLRDVALDLTDEIRRNSRPLKMLVDPPDGKRYILSHGINTCLVSLSLADQFNYDEDEVLDLATASLSLDLGMIEIPSGLWARGGSLSDRAGKEVRKHPVHSKEIVGTAVNGDETLKDLVHQHHERSNGSGYPQGLEKGEQHPLAPVLGTADAYVAMVEDRPYRDAKPPDVAMMTLLRNRDEFDKSVVRGLVRTIGIYPNGCVVLLSDGRLALVKSQNPDKPTGPETLVITDEDRNRLSSPRPLDLASNGVEIEKTVKW